MIKKFSLFINLLLLMASKVQAQIVLKDQTTHLFLYADINILFIEQLLGISIAEILSSEYTVPVEARGWELMYATVE